MVNIRFIIVRLIIMVLLIPLSLMGRGQSAKSSGSVAFTIDEKDLIPEGITYDPATHQFFISSICKEKVVAVDDKGSARDFLKSGQDGILQTLGMKVDNQTRRFWVVSNMDAGNIHQSAVHVFDIESGTLIKKFILSKDTAHLFNDIALAGNGDAYITDSYSRVIYTVPADLAGLRPFAESDSFLKGSNGLVVSPDGKLLYVATSEGITIVNLKTLDIRPIRNPGKVSAAGIDGLVFFKESLFGVTNSKDNESEMFIARYKLSTDLKEISGIEIIDKGNPLFNLPTTCVIAGDYLYCLANTSLRLYFQDKTNSKGNLRNPIILKYKITD